MPYVPPDNIPTSNAPAELLGTRLYRVTTDVRFPGVAKRRAHAVAVDGQARAEDTAMNFAGLQRASAASR